MLVNGVVNGVVVNGVVVSGVVVGMDMVVVQPSSNQKLKTFFLTSGVENNRKTKASF